MRRSPSHYLKKKKKILTDCELILCRLQVLGEIPSMTFFLSLIPWSFGLLAGISENWRRFSVLRTGRFFQCFSLLISSKVFATGCDEGDSATSGGMTQSMETHLLSTPSLGSLLLLFFFSCYTDISKVFPYGHYSSIATRRLA